MDENFETSIKFQELYTYIHMLFGSSTKLLTGVKVFFFFASRCIAVTRFSAFRPIFMLLLYVLSGVAQRRALSCC